MTQRLFTPGPTPLPKAVLRRLTQEPAYHRGPEADAVFASVHEGLKEVFQTTMPVLVLSCSGTGGVEAAMLNTLQAKEKVLVLNNGRFAQRWVDMAQALGFTCVNIHIPWGDAIEPEFVKQYLREHADCSAVWLVHSETSTGVVSDLQAIAACIREHSDALICVDAISSMAVHELRMDQWGVDVVVSSSQKGLMSPAGLATVALSERAWQQRMRLPAVGSLYYDLILARTAYERNRTPWTPAMLQVVALESALDLLLEEGMQNVWQRHQERSEHIRTSLQNMGYSMFAKSPAHGLSAVLLPRQCMDIVDKLSLEYGITVARGQDSLAQSVFRIGHMGYYAEEDINYMLNACRELIHVDS
jgi:aspartate aminotransferase-like enzyme